MPIIRPSRELTNPARTAPERVRSRWKTTRSTPWGWPAPRSGRASCSCSCRRTSFTKAIMLLLLLASVWCWAVIFDKSFRLMRLVPQGQRLRARCSGRARRWTISTASWPSAPDHPMALMFATAMEEWRESPQDRRRHLQPRAGRADRPGHGPDHGPRGRIAGDATSPGSARSPRPPRSSACSARSGAS